jgi:hypothetical protein
MKRFFRNNSLSIVVFTLFIVILIGHIVAGVRNYNQEQQDHQQPQVSYVEYVGSGDFIESVFENWESEFLQMGMYVILTVFLVQKGSAESKKLRGQEPEDRKPKHSNSENAPWAVRRGGAILKIYEHSLSLVFILLFLLSFWLHAYGGAQTTSEENQLHGQPPVSTIEYMGTSKFWFESFQNWQSEFLAVGAIVFLSIYLREKGSPESKQVNSPHSHTGNS